MIDPLMIRYWGHPHLLSTIQLQLSKSLDHRKYQDALRPKVGQSYSNNRTYCHYNNY